MNKKEEVPIRLYLWTSRAAPPQWCFGGVAI